jgi:hypothetical protein
MCPAGPGRIAAPASPVVWGGASGVSGLPYFAGLVGKVRFVLPSTTLDPLLLYHDWVLYATIAPC